MQIMIKQDMDYVYRDMFNVHVGLDEVILEFGNMHRVPERTRPPSRTASWSRCATPCASSRSWARSSWRPRKRPWPRPRRNSPGSRGGPDRLRTGPGPPRAPPEQPRTSHDPGSRPHRRTFGQASGRPRCRPARQSRERPCGRLRWPPVAGHPAPAPAAGPGIPARPARARRLHPPPWSTTPWPGPYAKLGWAEAERSWARLRRSRTLGALLEDLARTSNPASLGRGRAPALPPTPSSWGSRPTASSTPCPSS